MAVIGTGQYTIIDFDDIDISMTPPEIKAIDKLWLDISVIPNILKRWNGTEWENSRALSLSELDPEAQQRLDDIFSDDVITPDEKQVLKMEYDSIAIEEGTIYNQALTYNLDAEAATFQTTFDNLTDVMAKYFEDLTITSNIVLPDTPEYIRDCFVQYYNKKADLIKKITDKGTDKTKIIQTINMSQESILIKTNRLAIVGNPNMFTNDIASFEIYNTGDIPPFSMTEGISSFNVDSAAALDGLMSLKVVSSSAAVQGCGVYLGTALDDYWFPVTPGKYYCYSFYVKIASSSDVSIQASVKLNDASFQESSAVSINSAQGWVRIWKTFLVPSGITMCLPEVGVNTPDATVFFDCFQFEEVNNVLNEPSPWNAPSATIISGNMVATGTIVAERIEWNGQLIISAINTQDSTLQISAQNIDLTGAITFSSFDQNVGDLLFTSDPNSNQVYINGGSLMANSVSANKLNAYGLAIYNAGRDNAPSFVVDESGGVFFAGNLMSFDYDADNQTGWFISEDGSAEFNDAILRGSVILPNAGMTNSEGDVRIYAGSSFEDRLNAPFRVLQDGTVTALRGIFSGTFTGELQIGNIKISDTDPNTNGAQITLKTDGNQKTLVCFQEDKTFIDTPFTLGNDIDKFVFIDNSEHSFSVNKDTLLITQFNKNLVVNSTWNNGISNWYLNSAFIVDTNPESDKPYSCMMTANRSGLTSDSYHIAVCDAIEINADGTKVFTLSFDVKIASLAGVDGGAVVFLIRTFNDQSSYTSSSASWAFSITKSMVVNATGLTDGVWKRFSLVFAPPSGKYIRVGPYIARNGNMRWREVQLEPGNKATEYGVHTSEVKKVFFPNRANGNLIEFNDDMFDITDENGTLLFNSNSSRSNHDFVFEKNSGIDSVSVFIQGQMEVNDSIKAGNIMIQKKTDAGNEGIDFIMV